MMPQFSSKISKDLTDPILKSAKQDEFAEKQGEDTSRNPRRAQPNMPANSEMEYAPVQTKEQLNGAGEGSSQFNERLEENGIKRELYDRLSWKQQNAIKEIVLSAHGWRSWTVRSLRGGGITLFFTALTNLIPISINRSEWGVYLFANLVLFGLIVGIVLREQFHADDKLNLIHFVLECREPAPPTTRPGQQQARESDVESQEGDGQNKQENSAGIVKGG